MSATTGKEDDNIARKLLRSEAVASLELEETIATALRAARWETTHGCYYQDVKEDKLRELDVHALRVWESRKGQSPGRVCRVHVLAEAKRCNGLHLTFPRAELRLPPRDQYYWVGVDKAVTRSFLELLRRFQVPLERMKRIQRELEAVAYPGPISCMFREHPPLPDAPFTATTFVETNLGNWKAVDESTLWKAISQLTSACAALKAHASEAAHDWWRPQLSESVVLDDKLLYEALDDYAREAHELDIYHPCVVVTSMLWKKETDAISNCDWVRLVRSGHAGVGSWWCDVVSSGAISKYVTMLSEHYHRHFKARRLRQVVPG